MHRNNPVASCDGVIDSFAAQVVIVGDIQDRLLITRNEWGWIKTAPVIKTKKLVSKRIRWLTREEANRLIDCMPDTIRPVVVFALSTGLRRSNILDLEWTQVDM